MRIKNPDAVALGKMKKTITPKAIAARIANMRKAGKARWDRPRTPKPLPPIDAVLKKKIKNAPSSTSIWLISYTDGVKLAVTARPDTWFARNAQQGKAYRAECVHGPRQGISYEFRKPV